MPSWRPRLPDTYLSGRGPSGIVSGLLAEMERKLELPAGTIGSFSPENAGRPDAGVYW
jgi:hypothetical protein